MVSMMALPTDEEVRRNGRNGSNGGNDGNDDGAAADEEVCAVGCHDAEE